jgi:hypothetical protein
MADTMAVPLPKCKRPTEDGKTCNQHRRIEEEKVNAFPFSLSTIIDCSVCRKEPDGMYAAIKAARAACAAGHDD